MQCTTFAAGNGLTATGDGAGNMFDVTVLNPAGLTITSLDGHYDSSASPTVTVDVYITPNTYIGVETNAAAWTRVATGTATGAGQGTPTPVDISDFCLPPGSYGMLVWAICSAGGIDYTTGANNYANTDMTIQTGNGMPSLFTGGINSPRTWNGCLFYDIGTRTGEYNFIGSGGCSSITNQFTSGVPTYGQPFSVTISGAPANEPLSFVLLGFTPLNPPTGIPLDAIAMTGCLMHADGTLSLAAPTDATGTGVTAPFGIPNDPAQLGAQILTQPFVKDLGANPFGAVTGDGYRAKVGCP